MPRIWINDALTLEETVQPHRVNEQTGQREPDPTQPPVRIGFRPPLSTTLMRYVDEPITLSVEKKIEQMHKFLCDHLASWDVEDADGKTAPLTPASMAHLPAPYLNAIERAIIEGSSKVRTVEKN
jgi:hypothetical protein